MKIETKEQARALRDAFTNGALHTRLDLKFSEGIVYDGGKYQKRSKADALQFYPDPAPKTITRLIAVVPENYPHVRIHLGVASRFVLLSTLTGEKEYAKEYANVESIIMDRWTLTETDIQKLLDLRKVRTETVEVSE